MSLHLKNIGSFPKYSSNRVMSMRKSNNYITPFHYCYYCEWTSDPDSFIHVICGILKCCDLIQTDAKPVAFSTGNSRTLKRYVSRLKLMKKKTFPRTLLLMQISLSFSLFFTLGVSFPVHIHKINIDFFIKLACFEQITRKACAPLLQRPCV